METKDPNAPVTDKDEAADSSWGKMIDAVIPEALKRAMFMGAGMLFMTEEGIRKGISEFNLPRDAASYIIKQSEKSRRELFIIVQRELNRFFSRINISQLTKEVMDGITLDVNTRITFHTKKDATALVASVDQVKARPRRKPKKNAGEKAE